MNRRPGQSSRLSDCQPLMITSAVMFVIGPLVTLPHDAWIFGEACTLPAIAALWLVVYLWRRFNPPSL